MASTLVTVADTTARDALSPAVGDTVYQIDNNKINVCSALGPVVWQSYDSDGVGGDDLAYPDAKTGNPTSGTNYVITAQPKAHYDGSKINGANASGNPSIGQVMGGAGYVWQDRSGNGNDATQDAATYQPTYFHNQGNYGLQWPVNIDLAWLNTNYTQASSSPGHTVVAVASVPSTALYAGLVCNNSSSGPIAGLSSAGLSIHSTQCNVINRHFGTNMGISSANQRNARLTTVFSCVAINEDQKLFYDLDEIGTASTAYTTGAMDNYLNGDYLLGEGFHSWGSTAVNGGGGVIYEVLIFRGDCGYSSDGSNLTEGNLKVVVDYLMNKYGIA